MAKLEWISGEDTYEHSFAARARAKREPDLMSEHLFVSSEMYSGNDEENVGVKYMSNTFYLTQNCKNARF